MTLLEKIERVEIKVTFPSTDKYLPYKNIYVCTSHLLSDAPRSFRIFPGLGVVTPDFIR